MYEATRYRMRTLNTCSLLCFFDVEDNYVNNALMIFQEKK